MKTILTVTIFLMSLNLMADDQCYEEGKSGKTYLIEGIYPDVIMTVRDHGKFILVEKMHAQEFDHSARFIYRGKRGDFEYESFDKATYTLHDSTGAHKINLDCIEL